MNAASDKLETFRDRLSSGNVIEELRAGLIGEGAPVQGPFGERPLVYADYVASGRALRQVEEFILQEVLPYYANSHTEASYCGSFMTRLRGAARARLARLVGAGPDYAVIFTGAGATAAINRLVELLGVGPAARRGERPLVLVGPYEHHSNILPWRESGAEIVEIGEGPEGGPDLDELEAVLHADGRRALRVAAFSAASNVTGIITDVGKVTELLNRHGVVSIWDYAGGGPYLPIDMAGGTPRQKDAVVVSPHKFVGGPGASGVLVLRRSAVSASRPVWPGGATVRFVSPWAHDYIEDVVAREEGGTPNIVGDIRAALAFLVKDAIGQEMLDARHEALNRRALEVWRRNPNLDLLGTEHRDRLPIFSFRVHDRRKGGFLHHQLFTRLLSDCHGIQARGGCACAGPYAHRLLGLDRAQSEHLRRAVLAGDEISKPGWVRLNFSALMDDAKADYVIDAVDALAREPYPAADGYWCDAGRARFHPCAEPAAGG